MKAKYGVEAKGIFHQPRVSHSVIEPSASNAAAAPPTNAPVTRRAVARVKWMTTTSATAYRPISRSICRVVIQSSSRLTPELTRRRDYNRHERNKER